MQRLAIDQPFEAVDLELKAAAGMQLVHAIAQRIPHGQHFALLPGGRPRLDRDKIPARPLATGGTLALFRLPAPGAEDIKEHRCLTFSQLGRRRYLKMQGQHILVGIFGNIQFFPGDMDLGQCCP